jgi:glycerol-3-phosphate dehydrogenase
LESTSAIGDDAPYDIAIVGGGVNGCGIARDAAGRGWRVFLCEQDDLASATSSASTKLIHGGLRYLEYYEFRLVREALIERERLWSIAPHIVWPLRFVLPYREGLRPAWLLRLGLFVYDHLGGRKRLPPTRRFRLADDEAGAPLQRKFRFAFEYSDCWVDDARLVVLNARDAARRGAVIATRTRCVGGARRDRLWELELSNQTRGRYTIRARHLVNAAGPWVSDVLGGALGVSSDAGVRLVKGSHIVAPRLYQHERCYFFQNADKRIFFAIPFADRFTMIGTTDIDYRGDPRQAHASPEEIRYLCDGANAYFKQALAPEDVVWSFAGVRPLFDDGASEARSATRDYVLKLDAEGGAPLLSVFGGKITTYRRLAESALAALAPTLPPARREAGWTGRESLPGGDFPIDGAAGLAADLLHKYPFLDAEVARRLVRAYGRDAFVWLGDAADARALGQDFGSSLSEREVDYLMREEWAMTAEDVLWRRSKLGLSFDAEHTQRLASFMTQRASSSRPPS